MKMSKEIKAGLIALLAIVGFVLMYQFMKGKSFFTTDNQFFAKYENVEGLEQSSPVSINGLKVGQVVKISPITTKDGKIQFLIQFSVEDKFQFSKKSTVEVFQQGLMGGSELKVNLNYGNPLAKDGDTLVGVFKLSLMDNVAAQVGPVKDQLQTVLKSVDSLANNANKVMDAQNRAEIKSLLAMLNKTVASFEGTSRNVNSLLNNSDPKLQKVLDNASQTMNTANNAIGKYGNLAESIDTKKLNATISDLDVTVGQLNNVIADIQNGKGTLGKVMKDEQLYNNLTETTKSLNELVLDMKTNPKRYIHFSVFGKNNKE